MQKLDLRQQGKNALIEYMEKNPEINYYDLETRIDHNTFKLKNGLILNQEQYDAYENFLIEKHKTKKYVYKCTKSSHNKFFSVGKIYRTDESGYIIAKNGDIMPYKILVNSGKFDFEQKTIKLVEEQ